LNDEKRCYVCNTDLELEYKKEIIQQGYSNFFENICVGMIKFDGVKKLLCVSCYKNQVQGIKIYQENNPDWKPPKEIKS